MSRFSDMFLKLTKQGYNSTGNYPGGNNKQAELISDIQENPKPPKDQPQGTILPPQKQQTAQNTQKYKITQDLTRGNNKQAELTSYFKKKSSFDTESLISSMRTGLLNSAIVEDQ